MVCGWVDGWVDGWVAGKAGLRISYSNQKLLFDNLKMAIFSFEQAGPLKTHFSEVV
jgi:hypothetical protein